MLSSMTKGKLSRKGKGIIKRFLIISPYNYNAFKGGVTLFHPFSFSNSHAKRQKLTKANPLNRLVK